MLEKKTHIFVLLDRSGSMESIKEDMISGFNTFLIDQQVEIRGECTLSLTVFNTTQKVIFENKEIKYTYPLTLKEFNPSGYTALLDSLGYSINKLRDSISRTNPKEIPDNVIFVVITDGLENASSEYTKKEIKNIIEYHEKKCGWNFVFLGANQDAIQEGNKYGIKSQSSITYSPTSIGIDSIYKTLSSKTINLRKGESKNIKFNKKDRNHAIGK